MTLDRTTNGCNGDDTHRCETYNMTIGVAVAGLTRGSMGEWGNTEGSRKNMGTKKKYGDEENMGTRGEVVLLSRNEDHQIGRTEPMGNKKTARKARWASSSFILLLCALGLGLVLVGCSGDDGSVGAPGPAGPPGPAGSVGPAGATGADGSSGSAGARGPAGPAGPAGAQGASGSTGVAGATGAEGSAAVVPGSTLTKGLAIKGPIANAVVVLSLYGANNGDACPASTTAIAGSGALALTGRCIVGSSGTTDENGLFALTIPGDQTVAAGPFLITVSNGTMLDEVTGATVTGPQGGGINTEFRSLLALDFADDLRLPGGAANIIPVAVTALTEMAASRALAAGVVAPSPADAHSANTQTAELFGLSGVDITTTIPSNILDPNSSNDSDVAKKYGLINAAFSQLAQVLEGDQDVLDVVNAVSNDYDDGILNSQSRDGLDASVTVTGASRTMPASTMGNTFAAAIETIQASSVNQTGFTIDAATITTISKAHIMSNNIVTLADNGCVVADARLPSGSMIFVRQHRGGTSTGVATDGAADDQGIVNGVATLRNAAGGLGDTIGPDLAGRLAVTFPGGGLFSAQSVTIRCILANYSQGQTAAGDRGTGQIMISPRFTIRDPVTADVALGLATQAHVDALAGSARTITGVLSGMLINNNPTGVTASQPEGTVITITGLRDGNGSTINVTTPLPPTAILNQGGNVVRFVPNALIAALSNAGISQFDTLVKSGTFVYEISPGMNLQLHPNTTGATESNAPPAGRAQTCNGDPDTMVSITPTGTCTAVNTIRGSLTVAQ